MSTNKGDWLVEKKAHTHTKHAIPSHPMWQSWLMFYEMVLIIDILYWIQWVSSSPYSLSSMQPFAQYPSSIYNQRHKPKPILGESRKNNLHRLYNVHTPWPFSPRLANMILYTLPISMENSMEMCSVAIWISHWKYVVNTKSHIACAHNMQKVTYETSRWQHPRPIHPQACHEYDLRWVHRARFGDFKFLW